MGLNEYGSLLHLHPEVLQRRARGLGPQGRDASEPEGKCEFLRLGFLIGSAKTTHRCLQKKKM